MATDIRYNNTHAAVQIGSIVASLAGHIENIIMNDDTDNGKLVGKGDFVDLDLYKEGTATKFSGVIRKIENGFYLIEVVGDTDAFLVYNKPETDGVDYTFVKRDNKFFYIPAGKEARSYQLRDGDSWWVTAEGFDGEVTSASVGKTVSIGTAGKLKVATGA